MRELGAGDRLDHYELESLLARTGMASIFKAVDTSTGAQVTLKIPHAQLERDLGFSRRFRREEEIGQKIEHPNIIRVLKTEQKTRMYMAMEYVDGRSLRALLDERRPLPIEEALDIARQVAEGLAHVHARGVVHRDVKPENILVTGDRHIKLLDFGIALDASARRLTSLGLSNRIGTPDYMAPEQIRGRRGDARTDVYALGLVLYEMATGRLPFSAASPHALMRAKLTEPPRPPRHHLPSLDPQLETIILNAIAPAPRDRYPNATELLAALRNPAGVTRGPPRLSPPLPVLPVLVLVLVLVAVLVLVLVLR